MTARVLGRGLSGTLRVASGLAVPILLVALLYAPFSGWGPFAQPSPLDGCPEAFPGALAHATPWGLALAFASYAARLLMTLGVVGFLAGAVIRDLEPCLNDRPVRGLWRTCSVAVAAGWILALVGGLSPC